MTIEDLKNNELILFEAVSGSRAYGTDLPTSDTDIRGVFISPHDHILGNKYIDQVNDKMNDITYYEIGKFIHLLNTNNPNILELLNMKDTIIQKHPLFDLILENKEKFVTKMCRNSFGGYAVQQIKKARGMNKKIVNPMPKEKKSPIDFCYILEGNESYPLSEFLEKTKLEQSNCGLVSVPNARDIYALYYGDYKGIVKENKDGGFISNEIRLSSVPKGEKALCNITYNKDGYTKFCKDHKQYWSWVDKRNPDRYNENAAHGKGYDGKNLMHCHRLLDMSLEILRGEGINVLRPNREELLKIRAGEMDYDELVESAEDKIKLMDKLFNESDLPENVDQDFTNDLLIKIRKDFYGL